MAEVRLPRLVEAERELAALRVQAEDEATILAREVEALRVRLEEAEKLADALEQITDMPETEPWPTTSPELNWYSVVKHKSDLARKALAAWREKGSGS